MKDQTTNETGTAVGVPPPAPGSDSSFDPIRIIQSQEYMLRRQQELLDAAIKRNNALVAAHNIAETENAKLRVELDGYKRGKLWTMLINFIPTQEMLGRR